jgi:hypothetical protein
MKVCRSVSQAELAVPGFVARLAAGRTVAAPVVAEVPLVAERNRIEQTQAAQSQMTPQEKLGAAHIWLSCKSVIPRLWAAI